MTDYSQLVHYIKRREKGGFGWKSSYEVEIAGGKDYAYLAGHYDRLLDLALDWIPPALVEEIKEHDRLYREEKAKVDAAEAEAGAKAEAETDASGNGREAWRLDMAAAYLAGLEDPDEWADWFAHWRPKIAEMLTEDHCGDCTDAPMTCSRCLADKAASAADKAIAAQRDETPTAWIDWGRLRLVLHSDMPEAPGSWQALHACGDVTYIAAQRGGDGDA